MQIFGTATCDKCGETYYGEFNVSVTGEVSCIDCSNKQYLSKDLEFTVADSNLDLSDKYFEYFYRDLKILYNLYAKGNEDPSAEFYDGISVNSHKFYYMGNDLKIAEEAHELVYKLLMYLDNPYEDKYVDLAESIIVRYMDLRRRKFTTKEMEQFIKDIRSPEVAKIKRMLNY